MLKLQWSSIVSYISATLRWRTIYGYLVKRQISDHTDFVCGCCKITPL